MLASCQTRALRTSGVAAAAKPSRTQTVVVRASAAAYTPEQLEFMQRKKTGAGESAPPPRRSTKAPLRTARDVPTTVVSPSNSRAAAAAPASYGSSAAAANTSGLSPEQQAFLERKARESGSPAPSASSSRGRSASSTRGRSAPRAAAASSGSSSSGGYSSSSYKHVTAEEQRTLTPDQCDFLERKRSGGR